MPEVHRSRKEPVDSLSDKNSSETCRFGYNDIFNSQGEMLPFSIRRLTKHKSSYLITRCLTSYSALYQNIRDCSISFCVEHLTLLQFRARMKRLMFFFFFPFRPTDLKKPLDKVKVPGLLGTVSIFFSLMALSKYHGVAFL